MSRGAALELLDGVFDHPLQPLRDVVQRVRSSHDHEKCEMCAADIDTAHRHVVDTEERTLRCLCTHCFLLFSDDAAAHGRYRQVPDRVAALTGVEVGQADWDELQIPVGLAFFFSNSDIDRTVAFYPGPAGATESLLPLDAWERLTAAHPELGHLEPDVEAVIIRRGGERSECYRVPIDACYELIGKLRMTWVGFDGGSAARAEVDGFFARLGARSHA